MGRTVGKGREVGCQGGRHPRVVGGPEDVLSFATGVIAGNPEKEFVLKADNGVAYRNVDRVIDMLKQARVPVVYLLSDQEAVEGGGG